MSNFQFRSDKMVDEVVQFNQNLSKGIKNLMDSDEISAGVTPREEIYAEDKLKLYRYQPSTGRWRTFSAADGLAGTGVDSFTIDAAGGLNSHADGEIYSIDGRQITLEMCPRQVEVLYQPEEEQVGDG